MADTQRPDQDQQIFTMHRVLVVGVNDQNAFLGGLARLVDLGRLAGNADIALLRSQFPGLLTMDKWLAGAGKLALLAAIQSEGGEVALR